MIAFDLPNGQLRDAFWKGAYELGLLVVRCGERSIRLRPVLDVEEDVLQETVTDNGKGVFEVGLETGRMNKVNEKFAQQLQSLTTRKQLNRFQNGQTGSQTSLARGVNQTKGNGAINGRKPILKRLGIQETNRGVF